MRELMGPTKSAIAPAGTIREEFGNKKITCENIIHGSDSQENVLFEIKRFLNLNLTHDKEYTL